MDRRCRNHAETHIFYLNLIRQPIAEEKQPQKNFNRKRLLQEQVNDKSFRLCVAGQLQDCKNAAAALVSVLYQA